MSLNASSKPESGPDEASRLNHSRGLQTPGSVQRWISERKGKNFPVPGAEKSCGEGRAVSDHQAAERTTRPFPWQNGAPVLSSRTQECCYRDLGALLHLAAGQMFQLAQSSRETFARPHHWITWADFIIGFLGFLNLQTPLNTASGVVIL